MLTSSSGSRRSRVRSRGCGAPQLLMIARQLRPVPSGRAAAGESELDFLLHEAGCALAESAVFDLTIQLKLGVRP